MEGLALCDEPVSSDTDSEREREDGYLGWTSPEERERTRPARRAERAARRRAHAARAARQGANAVPTNPSGNQINLAAEAAEPPAPSPSGAARPPAPAPAPLEGPGCSVRTTEAPAPSVAESSAARGKDKGKAPLRAAPPGPAPGPSHGGAPRAPPEATGTSSSEEEEWNRARAKIPECGSHPAMSATERAELEALLKRYSCAFADSVTATEGTANLLHYEHVIRLTSRLPVFTPPRRVSPHAEAFARDEIKRLLELGLIQPSQAAYGSPVVLAPKKDGTWRFCVDYRRLNAITERDVFPLPRIDDQLDRLRGSMIFSTVDATAGFWQLPLDPASRQYTAFVVPWGHYEWRVTPFGVTNGPAAFSRAVTAILGPLLTTCVTAYIDDITVFSPSPSKCRFGVAERLLLRDAAWQWTEVHQAAFEALKAALLEDLVLGYPDFERPFILSTDASTYAIGAILSQSDGGSPARERPIAFISRTLAPAERNYTATELECLAVVWAIKYWRHFLLGGPQFLVRTDHQALQWLRSREATSGRLGRCSAAPDALAGATGHGVPQPGDLDEPLPLFAVAHAAEGAAEARVAVEAPPGPRLTELADEPAEAAPPAPASASEPAEAAAPAAPPSRAEILVARRQARLRRQLAFEGAPAARRDVQPAQGPRNALPAAPALPQAGPPTRRGQKPTTWAESDPMELGSDGEAAPPVPEPEAPRQAQEPELDEDGFPVALLEHVRRRFPLGPRRYEGPVAPLPRDLRPPEARARARRPARRTTRATGAAARRCTLTRTTLMRGPRRRPAASSSAAASTAAATAGSSEPPAASEAPSSGDAGSSGGPAAGLEREVLSSSAIAPGPELGEVRDRRKPRLLELVQDTWDCAPPPSLDGPLPETLRHMFPARRVRLLAAQKADPLCRKLFSWLENGVNEARCTRASCHTGDCYLCSQAKAAFVGFAGKFDVDTDGVLVRRPVAPHGRFVPVLPESWQDRVLYAYHDGWATAAPRSSPAGSC
eukprot:tig00000147_g9441.t1